MRSPILLAAFEILLRFALRGARILAEYGEAAPGRHEGTGHADVHVLLDLAFTGPAPDLRNAVGGEDVTTTNLWNVRLCKSAARTDTGAILKLVE